MVANIINEALFGYRYKHGDCAPLMKYVEDFNEVSLFRASARSAVQNQAVERFGESKAMLLGMAFPFLTELPVIGWYTLGQFKDLMHKVQAPLSTTLA